MNTGSFELEQVLGTLNTQYKRHDEELVEKFKKQDLMDKRYYLTSFPIPNTRKKKQRWSIKYNKFVGELWLVVGTLFIFHLSCKPLFLYKPHGIELFMFLPFPPPLLSLDALWMLSGCSLDAPWIALS